MATSLGCPVKDSSIGAQPIDGPYSACSVDDDCTDLAPKCLGRGSLGICTAMCDSPDGIDDLDPSPCPALPDDVLADVGCLPRLGVADELIGYCTIRCQGADEVCPDGMKCVEDVEVFPALEVRTKHCR